MSYTMKYIDSNESIVVRTFKGVVTVDDVIKLWEHAVENCLENKNIKAIITDYTGAKIEADVDEIHKFTDFFRKNLDKFKDIKIIQVMDSPHIVFPMLLEREFTELVIRPFATMKAAVQWAMM